MDKSKLSRIQTKSQFVGQNRDQTTDYLSAPKPISHFEQLQTQRKKQRNFIFWFAIGTSTLSLIFLAVLIDLQIHYRLSNLNSPQELNILNGHELEVLSVAIFGQIIGVIHIITKSLWNEEPFKEILRDEFGKVN